MQDNDNLDNRKKVLKKLILSEEDILNELESISKLAEPLFKIEEKTASIHINNDYDFSYKEKIILVAIGKYFAKHYSIIEKNNFNMQVLRDELGDVERTTLSKPLGELVKEKILIKPGKDDYLINQYKIKETLKDLIKKYGIN